MKDLPEPLCEVVLSPGEFHFGGGRTRISTLLGARYGAAPFGLLLEPLGAAGNHPGARQAKLFGNTNSLRLKEEVPWMWIAH